MAFKVQPPWLLLRFIAILLASTVATVFAAAAPPSPATVPFDDNYVALYGADGYHLVNQGTQISITMDKSSGAAFYSKLAYGSGFFRMRVKVPAGYTAGVVTAYFLGSEPMGNVRDEVDFEFLGDKDDKPITLQTNIFVNGIGGREERFHLWFDPSADFHNYSILWNHFHLVMFVDETPVRVMRNLTSKGRRFVYPTKPMLARGCVWDGSDWATDFGKTKVNWTRGPFTGEFQGFAIGDECASAAGEDTAAKCGSPDLWWNGDGYRSLTAAQKAAYEGVRRNLTYNYCDHKSKRKPECRITEWSE